MHAFSGSPLDAVSIYLVIYVCMHAYMSVYDCVCMHARVCDCAVCMSICEHVCACAHVHALCVCMCKCGCVCVCVTTFHGLTKVCYNTILLGIATAIYYY